MTGIGLGILFGLGCALVAAIVAVRARRSADARVSELTKRLEQTAELTPDHPAESVTTQGAELASSLEPAEVVDRILDAVVALPGVDAGLISVDKPEKEGSTHASGLTDDEIARTLLHMPGHPDLRALEVIYRYRLEDVGEGSKLPRSALTVALRAEGETIGSLAAISRSTAEGFPQGVQDALEALARRAGPALFNALRFTEARELAELDSLTGLHNRRLFYEFLAREIARARHYEARYVYPVIGFDLDDFKQINGARSAILGGDARADGGRMDAVALGRAGNSASPAASACRRRSLVILPESSRDDAELLADRIALAIRAQKIEKVGALRISAGVAELRAEDTAADLFKRADHALLRAKGSGKARIVAS